MARHSITVPYIPVMSVAATALALLAFLCIQPLGALQWRLLLPPPAPSLQRLLRVFALASTANNGLNSVVGHAAATALVAREPGVGAGPAVALLILDQLVVGVVKLLVLAMAVMTVWRTQGAAGSWSAMAPVGAAVAALLLLLVAARTRSVLPAWLPPRLRGWLDPLHSALRDPRAPRAVLRALPIGLCIRAMEALAVVAIQGALGLTVPLPQLPLFLAATAVATLLPVIPANLGTYEGALVGAYLLAGVPMDQALPAAALQHGCQLTAAILPGLVIGTTTPLRLVTARLRAAGRHGRTE